MDLTPPPGIDLDASHQSGLRATYSTTFGLAVSAVALRLFCRLRVSKTRLWWDDYLICAALVRIYSIVSTLWRVCWMLTDAFTGVTIDFHFKTDNDCAWQAFATGNFIDMMIWIDRGVGTHIYRWGLPGVSHFYINLFVCEILYTLSVVFTKYSILLFFWRIFSSTNIRIPIYVIATITTAWGLGVILTTVFQCVPIQGLWDYSIKAHCGVNINSFFIGNAVPNIITDWSLLILPLPYVWKIHQTTIQKFALSAAFIMGGFICIISIVRLIVMLEAYKTPSVDVTWVFIGPSTWTAVETNLGILSACLPSLRPFLRLLGGSERKRLSDKDIHKLSNWYGRSYSSAKSGYRPHHDPDSQVDGIDVTTSVDIETYPRHLEHQPHY
ncbi:Uncharacterized protein PECH_000995 [Penicillium ucsense]|uniref:Rhodopsin domain-containing protein n=1 Tax=Penicillium ucsense TaxID=2839758 RepID=A0A8J8WHB6_9EURO|nr:Uncharacterized protein PECM_008727 [Penicillium ucsense]KAF7733169.1 Uncharacterized protein PECH_000995 [Penicillium ucsense]